jgi:formylglycine-generating enzyme required for sulfatase activity
VRNRYGAGTTNAVGSESPLGDSRYGQADLAGNADEWVLDWFADTYSLACHDCAHFSAAQFRVLRGGDAQLQSAFVTASSRAMNAPPTNRGEFIGGRCARPAR